MSNAKGEKKRKKGKRKGNRKRQEKTKSRMHNRGKAGKIACSTISLVSFIL